jgi:cell division protein FtsW
LKAIPILFFLSIFFLALTLIPGIGKEVNGSRRWLSLAGLSFQPSEFVKYIAPAYFIKRLMEQTTALKFGSFFKIAAISALPLPLIALAPNNGSAAVVGMVLLIVCIVLEVPIRFWLMPLLIGSVICGAFAWNHPYVAARIKSYLNPTEDIKGKGHQPYQAKIAAGSGRLFGKGVGGSWQKLSYLPEAQNDYIAAIFAEEFGFIGMMTMLTLYSVVIFAAFAIALKAATNEGYYLASAIAFLLGIQIFLNLGVVSGLLPSTGLNLPFFSQGGSSLLANLMGVGLLISIAKEKNVAGH